MATIRIAGISGSLRAKSYNTMLLRAAAEMLPHEAELDLVLLHDIPLFNADVEARGLPAPVAALKARLEPAHGILFATPEYNYSVPGLLKNAIDWLSRPERETPIFGKPAAIIGASTSLIATARAQAHLRQIAFYNGMPLLASAELVLGRAEEKFDEDGKLIDPKSREKLTKLLQEFVAWIKLNQGGKVS